MTLDLEAKSVSFKSIHRFFIAANISPDELQPLPSDETTVEPVPDFLPSDNEDDDEDRPDEVDESTSAPYVPPHMPRFPSRHSFKQTPVSPNANEL
jgi:Transcription factor TFIID complex subunit 8 C-term